MPNIEEVRQFVAGSQSIEFRMTNKQEAYVWLQKLVIHLHYKQLSKKDKGVIREYAIAENDKNIDWKICLKLSPISC